jgi:hypothetical protein
MRLTKLTRYSLSASYLLRRPESSGVLKDPTIAVLDQRLHQPCIIRIAIASRSGHPPLRLSFPRIVTLTVLRCACNPRQQFLFSMLDEQAPQSSHCGDLNQEISTVLLDEVCCDLNLFPFLLRKIVVEVSCGVRQCSAAVVHNVQVLGPKAKLIRQVVQDFRPQPGDTRCV